ncbi:MAG: class I SAM-dependent methyltransferase [Sphingomonadaceae bacterium]|nr:class I SAM-dependent methyltransferase [Sphingomonadaceae bacterium]
MASRAEPDHAARMDGIYSMQRHIYDLTRKYYLLGRDRLIQRLEITPDAAALEIGCGTGRNLALATRQYPQASLHGLDISRAMLRSAEAKLADPMAQGRVQLAQGDATCFDAAALFGRAQFDSIWFSYTLSMIPNWRGALEMAIDLVAAGGSIHIVDFGQQAGLPRWFRHLLHRWLEKFHVTPRAWLIDTCQEIADQHHWQIQIERPYRDYAWLITLRRP